MNFSDDEGTIKQFEYLIKLVIIGDSGVGKTAFALRYSSRSFKQTVISTGIDLLKKIVTVDGKRVKVQIWDTAGQERFKSLTRHTFRGTHGLMIFYDITNQTSFDHLQYWMQAISDSNDIMEDVKLVLVGNKCDNESRRVVQKESGENLAKKYRVQFFEASGKTNINVDRVFDVLLREILARIEQKEPSTDDGSIHLKGEVAKTNSTKCCS